MPIILKINSRFAPRNGFSLLEVLIAAFILTVGILALIQMISASIRTSIDNRHQIVASGLAQEAVEIVRNGRDKNLLSQLNNVSREKYSIFKLGFPAANTPVQKCYPSYDANLNTAVTGDTSLRRIDIKCGDATNPERLYVSLGNMTYIPLASLPAPNPLQYRETIFRRYVTIQYVPSDTAPEGMNVTARVWWGSADPAVCGMATQCFEITEYISRNE